MCYKVNDDTIQDFYVLKDNGSTLDLITDKVVATGVAWNSSGDNSGGPVTATEALEKATSNWTNILSNTYNGNSGQATRARLITLEEAQEVGCKININDSCPIWLVDTSYTQWTSSSSSTKSDCAWHISHYSYKNVSFASVYDKIGVRAVVTISK